MDPESSFELLQRAQAGDSGALDRLLERYRPRLLRWASGRLPRFAREATDTDDIIQETMMRTFQNFNGFESRGEWALQAYLRQAVINRIRDELRRAGGRLRVELDEDLMAAGTCPLEAAIGRETMDRYNRALETLDEIEREAVIARLELGCSFREIAELTGKRTPDAARMMVARALERMARTMA